MTADFKAMLGYGAPFQPLPSSTVDSFIELVQVPAQKRFVDTHAVHVPASLTAIRRRTAPSMALVLRRRSRIRRVQFQEPNQGHLGDAW